MPPRSSWVRILLSGWERFLAQALRTTFLALLLRLLGPVLTSSRSCCDRWKGELSVRDTPYIHWACAVTHNIAALQWASPGTCWRSRWCRRTCRCSPRCWCRGGGPCWGGRRRRCRGPSPAPRPPPGSRTRGCAPPARGCWQCTPGPGWAVRLQPANCAVTSTNLEKLYWHSCKLWQITNWAQCFSTTWQLDSWLQVAPGVLDGAHYEGVPLLGPAPHRPHPLPRRQPLAEGAQGEGLAPRGAGGRAVGHPGHHVAHWRAPGVSRARTRGHTAAAASNDSIATNNFVCTAAGCDWLRLAWPTLVKIYLFWLWNKQNINGWC